MTEALITSLAKIKALRVISRTSAMQYKGARKSLPQIARELNVDAVIEGSVLRSGERVRITAQLIHAASDQHLWAESYERDFRDILSLQSEIARQVANQVRIILTPEERARLGSARQINPEAHDWYLRARYCWNKRTEESVKKGALLLSPGHRQRPHLRAGLCRLGRFLQHTRLLQRPSANGSLPKRKSGSAEGAGTGRFPGRTSRYPWCGQTGFRMGLVRCRRGIPTGY